MYDLFNIKKSYNCFVLFLLTHRTVENKNNEISNMKFGTLKKYYVKSSLNRMIEIKKHNHNFYIHIIYFLFSSAFLQPERKNAFNKALKCLINMYNLQ